MVKINLYNQILIKLLNQLYIPIQFKSLLNIFKLIKDQNLVSIYNQL